MISSLLLTKKTLVLTLIFTQVSDLLLTQTLLLTPRERPALYW